MSYMSVMNKKSYSMVILLVYGNYYVDVNVKIFLLLLQVLHSDVVSVASELEEFDVFSHIESFWLVPCFYIMYE